VCGRETLIRSPLPLRLSKCVLHGGFGVFGGRTFQLLFDRFQQRLYP
jgi:hypothetical protein